ncbi:hypothetical protein ACQWU4_13045 [Chryseobacterium sp. MIQD13]|uniref:hypothetical protein n=1 Tax=Chryseobacterium sp. MIQD13 TaxID=3422310 RepID=UPI003D2940C3
MLIEDELTMVYLNCNIREMIPFLKKLTPKEREETTVFLKRNLNKAGTNSKISTLSALAYINVRDKYKTSNIHS